jgi:ABC-type ATPase involved in cell division
VIMVTHDRKSAESVSHRVMEFLDGRIVRESRTGRKP